MSVAVLPAGCRTPVDSAEAAPAPFDSTPFAVGIDALELVLAGEAWSSFARLGREFALPPSSPGTNRVSVLGAGSTAVPVIPQPYLGATLVHDGGGYVVDAQRAGAPPDGLRFILYAIAESTGQPLLAAEIGHVDLRDVGSDLAMGFAVAVEVVGPAGTVAEYTGSFGLEKAGAGTAGDVVLFDHYGIDLAGRVTSGAEEIEFELVTGRADDVETTDADLSVNGDELYIIGVLDENVTTGEVEVDVSLMAEGDSLRLRSHSGVVGFEGKVALNGDPIAILTSGEETEVEPAAAIRLSAEQITLLRRLPGLVDRILGLVRATAVAIELD